MMEITAEELRMILAVLAERVNPMIALHQKLTAMLPKNEAAPPPEPPPTG